MANNRKSSLPAIPILTNDIVMELLGRLQGELRERAQGSDALQFVRFSLTTEGKRPRVDKVVSLSSVYDIVSSESGRKLAKRTTPLGKWGMNNRRLVQIRIRGREFDLLLWKEELPKKAV